LARVIQIGEEFFDLLEKPFKKTAFVEFLKNAENTSGVAEIPPPAASRFLTTSGAVQPVKRPAPLSTSWTPGFATHRRERVDWTHLLTGRIRFSGASLVQLPDASGAVTHRWERS
jgi:hypothetical protein